jgi:lactoylglutathione lyase
MTTNDTTTNYRLMHTMMRVLDLDKSIDFYTRLLGMKVLRNTDYEGGRFTNVFIGYASEDETAVLELTHNWDQKTPYGSGDAWGHIAIGVPDIYATCAALEKEDVNIPRPPGPMMHGTTVIAFIDDPDGHKIELIELIERK